MSTPSPAGRPEGTGSELARLVKAWRDRAASKIFPAGGRNPASLPTRNRPTPADAAPAVGQVEQAATVYSPEGLPWFVAVLLVQQDGDRLHVVGVHGGAAQAIPVSPLADDLPAGPMDPLARAYFEAERVVTGTSSWSHDQEDLVEWLNERREQVGTGLHLAIMDTSGQETPWEQLRLDPVLKERDPLRLGAAAAVTRWIPPVRRRTTVSRVSASEERRGGGVFAYIAAPEEPATGSHSADDQAAFTRDRETLKEYLVDEASTDGQEFLQRLRSGSLPHEKIRLLYAAAHGRGGRNDDDQGLGTLWLQEFEHDGHLLRLNGLVVFFNGCGSARMIVRANRAHSFPAVCLDAGAVGFIGSTYEVGSSYAAEVLSEFVREFSRPMAPSIADFLRRRRLAADQDVEYVRAGQGPTGPGQETYFRWIDAFSYVYYGDPLASLQLDPARGLGSSDRRAAGGAS